MKERKKEYTTAQRADESSGSVVIALREPNFNQPQMDLIRFMFLPARRSIQMSNRTLVSKLLALYLLKRHNVRVARDALAGKANEAPSKIPRPVAISVMHHCFEREAKDARE